MTVFHLISSEGYYGAEAMLVALAQNLLRLGCNSVVGMFHDSRRTHTEVGDRARRDGLPVESIACRGRWDGSVVKQLQALLKQHRVDVLHTHGYKADFYGYLAAWPSRVALLATCHNWPSKQPLMRAYARLDRRLLRHFESVVAVSDSVERILRESGMPASKLFTIPNGVEVERFSGAAPALRGERTWEARPVVGFVGRLVECKGGPVLLEAAQKVTAVYPESVFAAEVMAASYVERYQQILRAKSPRGECFAHSMDVV